MSWDKKQRGGLYYYRVHRLGSRVVKEYVGRGPAAWMIADRDAEDRARRGAALEAWQLRKACAEAWAGTADDVANACWLLLAAALVTLGYHNHRGQWRRRRMATTTTTYPRRPARGPSEPASPAEHAAFVERLQALVARADGGDGDALHGLRHFLDESPEFVARVGDLNRQLESHYVGALTGDDLLRRECVTREAERLRAELARAGATPLESLLVDHVVGCRLGRLAAGVAAAGPAETTGERAFRLKQEDAAARRFLAAADALQKLRDLAPEATGPTPILKLLDMDAEAA